MDFALAFMCTPDPELKLFGDPACTQQNAVGTLLMYTLGEDVSLGEVNLGALQTAQQALKCSGVPAERRVNQ